MKKGIALIVTIGMIMLIVALINQNLLYSKKPLDDYFTLKEQNQLLFLMKNFIQNMKNLKNIDQNMLREKFIDQSEFVINDQKSSLSATFFCSSMQARIDFNKLITCIKKDNEQCLRAFKNFLQKYELADEDFLIDIFIDTISPVEFFQRSPQSRISLDDKRFVEGCIDSFFTIKKIFWRYYEQTKDPNIFKITKEDFFDTFYLVKKKLDYEVPENFDENLKKILECDDDEICKEEFKKINKSLKEISNCSSRESNNTIKTKDLVKCNVKFYKNDNFHEIIFKYNLQKSKIESIDEFF